MPDIMKRLGHEVLVLDGAMGTMLQRAGLPAGECPELLNITAPEMIGDVHRFYQLAGADCSITNTFGGSRPKLAEYGYGDRVEEFNRAAVRIAKSHGSPHVLADMGPTGLVMEPLGPATFDEVFAAFAEQAAALAAENPDAIFIETMTDIAEARCAVLAAKSRLRPAGLRELHLRALRPHGHLGHRARDRRGRARGRGRRRRRAELRPRARSRCCRCSRAW